MKKIKLLDLPAEQAGIQDELNQAIAKVVAKADYIKGASVTEFEENLGKYLGGANVIGVGNGTDALQIALMSIGVGLGDEVIIPGFTYIATAEAVCLVGATPVLVDIKESDFTINPELIKKAITSKTKAIIPVHMYGQPCDMELIMAIAKEHDLKVIEDNAQALGAEIMYKGSYKKTSTIGDIGCLSFFPSKNLGAFGDGGAVVTKDKNLAEKMRMIANHGQRTKYNHEIIGMNSRLDTIQAAVLNVKLKYLDQKNLKRIEIAGLYNDHLTLLTGLVTPLKESRSVHVYHQYTIKVASTHRDKLKQYLNDHGIPARVYYPKTVTQHASMKRIIGSKKTNNGEGINKEILSLPIHPNLSQEQVGFITNSIKQFFGTKRLG